MGKLAGQLPFLDWAVAGRALPGETESGDQHVVQPFAGGVLLAVVDGLGHGAEAAAAARVAVATLERHAQESVVALLKRCHEELRKTRGVVLTLASLTAANGTLTWLGVGNVEGVLLRADAAAGRARESVLLRGGVVGYQLPALYTSTVIARPGDTLLLATDGIRSNFSDRPGAGQEPAEMAERILTGHGKDTDDALVLVARYRGGVP